MLEGKNFLIEVDGKEQLIGYVTTRWVKANSPKDAQINAVDLITNDEQLISMTRSHLKKAWATPRLHQ